jgi:hypothetical protein
MTENSSRNGLLDSSSVDRQHRNDRVTSQLHEKRILSIVFKTSPHGFTSYSAQDTKVSHNHRGLSSGALTSRFTLTIFRCTLGLSSGVRNLKAACNEKEG